MQQPVTSIVILTRNQLADTQLCVASIIQHTPEPYEFVFVDNGSTDGTVEYLRSIPGATVIENDANLGFGGGCNQGVARSRGGRVLLLNNDVVVTPGWLAALHRELDSSPLVGVAGPRSNRVAGAQIVPEVGYDLETLDGLDEFAAKFTGARAGDGTTIARLVGFCMLFEREVLERIGGFDLRFGLGNFEDDDISLRVGVAGWQLRIAHDSYIHHTGSRTFIGERIDYAATMARNWERFARKWGALPHEHDMGRGWYDADAIVARTTWDDARHHSSMVGALDTETQIELGATRARTLLVLCDRAHRESTAQLLRSSFTAVGPQSATTVVVRTDPRDDASLDLLDQVADELGDATLPDVVLVAANDENDAAALRAVDAVLVLDALWGPAHQARELDVATVTPSTLSAWLNLPRAAPRAA